MERKSGPGRWGSEFKAAFETACQAHNLALFVLPPRRPKPNSRVEWRNRRFREESRQGYDDDLDLPPLQVTRREAECLDHAIRPHQALGYRAPITHHTALSTPDLSRRY